MSERKYGHKGYMQDDSRDRPRGRGPRPKKDGPRGRGLGRPTETSFKCARCGERIEVVNPIEAAATCGNCGSALHSCTNCRHFDTSARFECRVEVEERVAGKSKQNDCGLFEPKLVQGFAGDSGSAPDDAKSEFDSLFDF